VTRSFAVPVEPPSVIISIVPPSSTLLAALGSDESTSPAAEPSYSTVIAELVIAVPPTSKVIAASAPEIAPCKAVKILTTFPPSGIATKVDEAVEISSISAVIK